MYVVYVSKLSKMQNFQAMNQHFDLCDIREATLLAMNTVIGYSRSNKV